MNVRRATGLLLGVAQVSTGVYLVVYLVRWQWNRALICGVLFIATEVLIIGRMVLHRLRSLEGQLDATLSAQSVQRSLVESRPPEIDRFAWLREASTRTNVFLPVLLGAGVVASALAWLVETAARRTARPTLERSLVTAMAPLAFPPSGFLGPAPPRVALARSSSAPHWAGLLLATLVVAVGIGLLIDVVADATQRRPDRLDLGATTVVDMRFRGARAVADPERHASNLMAACSPVFGRPVPTLAVIPQGRGRARLVLDGDIGDQGATRLRGCLEDTTFAGVQASVVEFIEVPPPRG